MDIEPDYAQNAGRQDDLIDEYGQPIAANKPSPTEEPIDDSEEPQPPFKLAISEYEEIAQRLEQSIKSFEQIKGQL